MLHVIMEVILLGAFLFYVGICGVIFNKKSLIHMLMSIELMLLGTNLLLVSFSLLSDDIYGEALAFVVLGTAGAESALGLGLLLIYYIKKGSLQVSIK